MTLKEDDASSTLGNLAHMELVAMAAVLLIVVLEVSSLLAAA